MFGADLVIFYLSFACLAKTATTLLAKLPNTLQQRELEETQYKKKERDIEKER